MFKPANAEPKAAAKQVFIICTEQDRRFWSRSSERRKVDPVPGEEVTGHDTAGGGAHGRQPAPFAALRLHGRKGRWLAIFVASLGALLIRFLMPGPVGQADNRDGPRLMCGLGLGPVTGRHPRFFRFAYFDYVPRQACSGRVPYLSSELIALEVSRLLTSVLGLPGSLNLIAAGVLLCALAAVAIASLAVGLRIRLWAQWLVAAACWLIIADAAFFDVFGARHMVGTNLATSFAFVVAAGLAGSMIWQLLTRPARRAVGTAGPWTEQVAAISPGSRR